jgi:hypothetical protein
MTVITSATYFGTTPSFTDALTEDMMAVLPKHKIPDTRHAACVAAAIAVLNVSALLPAGGETIATFTRNPSNPILRGVRTLVG